MRLIDLAATQTEGWPRASFIAARSCERQPGDGGVLVIEGDNGLDNPSKATSKN